MGTTNVRRNAKCIGLYPKSLHTITLEEIGMQQKTYRRRQYLVNAKFQLRFISYIAIAVLTGLTAIYFSNLFYYDILIKEGTELGLHPEHPYFEFISDQRHLLNRFFLVVSTFTFIALMVFGLFLSHRIAGPIYRIEMYMQQVAAGEEHLAPVKLRDGDFFPEIADIVNNAIEHTKSVNNKDAS